MGLPGLGSFGVDQVDEARPLVLHESRPTRQLAATLAGMAITGRKRQAQKKNEFAVITSFLIIDQNFAIQVVEGERQSVNANSFFF
jgi:hypothetical protein